MPHNTGSRLYSEDDLKPIMNFVARENGYPDWKEMYNWICREGQFPSVVGQLIEGAMIKVAIKAAQSLNQSKGDEGIQPNDMTAEEFYSGFNLEFLTIVERKTIYELTELYAKGKRRMADAEFAKPHEEMKAKFQRLDELEIKTIEQELIIKGIEEGSYKWKSEYDNCRSILQKLVDLKIIKDTFGSRIESNESRIPIAWDAAKEFLKTYQHE